MEHHHIIQPTDALKPFVRYFWSLESPGSGSSPRGFRTIADGCPGFLFQSPEHGHFSREGKQLPDAFLFGQATMHGKLDLSGDLAATGICFYPQALKTLFGLNATLLTDSCAGIGDLYQHASLSDQLSGIGAPQERMRLLSDFLLSELKKRKTEHHKMDHALELILRSKGSISVKNLCETICLTERTFERRFKEYVGISPKLFSRICRFQSSLKQFQGKDYNSFSDIVFAHDYADQSHVIRSFKEFAGISPNKLQKQPVSAIDNFSEIRE